MELKLNNTYGYIRGTELLIVPYGIETRKTTRLDRVHDNF